MMIRKYFFLACLFLCFFYHPALVDAAPVADAAIADLQREWATAKYGIPDIAEKKRALSLLEIKAERLVERFPTSADARIVQALVLASDAELSKNMASLPKVNRAKALLEQAIAIDPTAMNGTAHILLGTLYYQLPGWPISFGNYKRAKEHFAAALAIDPNGMDVNYFYGGYLLHRGRGDEAVAAFQRALAAKPRPEFAYIENPRRSEMRAAIACQLENK